MSLEKIGIIAGILTGFFSGVYFLYQKFTKHQLKFRKKLQYTWTNEGNILRIGRESHYCDLEIQTNREDGEISGVIDCRNLKSKEEIKNISIHGKLFLNFGIVTLSNFSRGSEIFHGKAKIKLKGKLLEWTLIKGDPKDFPKSTKFWRHDVDVADII